MLLLQWMVGAVLEVCVGRGEAVEIFEVWGQWWWDWSPLGEGRGRGTV